MASTLAQLPDELLAHICCHLTDPLDVYHLSLVDRRRRRLAISDVSSPWQTFVLTWWRGLGQGSHGEPDVAHRLRDRVRKGKLRQLVKEEERLNEPDAQPQTPLYSIEKLLDTRAYSSSPSGSGRTYHDFCRQRLNAEDVFLKRAKHHLQNLAHGQLVSALDILRQTGSEIRDFLHLLIWDQNIACTLDSPDGWEDDERWPRSREVHLRALNRTARPHKGYHLALYHFARNLLHHLQKREAVETCRLLRRQEFEALLWNQRVRGQDTSKPDSRAFTEVCRESSEQVEEALIAIAQFRKGEKRLIAEYLDLLSVYIYLKLRSHPDLLTSTRSVVTAIFIYMSELSYGSASPTDFQDLDNSFLHVSLFCPHNRATLPLTLTVIFVSIASRLGIAAGISNLPGRIVAVVQEATESQGLSPTFFVDGTRLPESPIREPSDEVEWASMVGMGIHSRFGETNWTPATGAAILSRSAQNILHATMSQRDTPAVLRVMRQRARGDTDARGGHSRSRNAHSSTPRPTTLLHDYLNRHPATVDNQARPLLPVEVRPLDFINSHWLPTRRPEIQDDGEAGRDSNYCIAWVLAEVAPHILGEAGITYLAEQGLSLDVVFTKQGQREFEKAAKRQRALSYIRRRQGPVGVYGTDEEEVDILPVSDDQDENSVEISDDDDSSEDEEASDVEVEADDQGNPTDASRTLKARIPRVFARDLVIPTPSPHLSPVRPTKVLHTVGTLFQHRTYGYHAVIVAWDPDCQAGEAWEFQMGVDNLPEGGRTQPFYHVLVADGTSRYVAQCNVKPVDRTSTDQAFLSGFKALFGVRDIGSLFRCVDLKRRRLRKTKETTSTWPGEGSDSEDD